MFFICGLLIFTSYVSADELAPNAKSAILIEASTGRVLYEKNADEALAPASMTKIMTLLLTMEAVDKGNIKLDSMVTVSENAASMGGSQVFLAANEQYKLEEIIKAVCIASGNDAAVVLAESIGGSLDKFIEMMNNKAKELGLTSTHFVNVYGLDAEGHMSSARDMAIMARELIKHDVILKYSSIYEEYLNKPDGSNLWMVNTNKLVRFYSGVDGLKTGYTGNAGYCLTATGVWNGMRLISVVMGETTQEERSNDTVAMLNYGKTAYKLNTIIARDKTLGEVNIELGERLKEDVILLKDATDLISINDDVPKYTYKIKTEKLTAPIKKGDIIGKADIYSDGEKLMTIDLTIKRSVKKCSFMTLLKRMLSVIILGSK